MRSQYFLAITFSVLLPCVTGKCSITSKKKVGKVICSDINSDEYLSELFNIRTNLTDTIEDKNITKLTINVSNSKLPIVDEWFYLPWDYLLGLINTLKLVNSSVTNVISLFRFPSLETLDISGNNISDFNFLTKLKKLKHLHLRHSAFTKDSSLVTYLQRYQNRLKLIDLGYNNLNEFNLFNNIEKYDLSYNPILQSINFNQSFSIRYLNLSGNIQLQSLSNNGKSDFLCISRIDLSHLNNSFNFSLLKNIKIADEILLNNNNIQILDESIFTVTDLLSKKCSTVSRISIDLSNTNIETVSSNYFSTHILGSVNMSTNNLIKLEGSIFSRSEITTLDLSNSNISTIGPNVFNYLTVTLLNLSKNSITSLEGVFANIESVKKLDISFNPIRTLTKNTFKKCQDLELLSLSNTFVNFVGDNAFENLPSLRKLTLSFTDAFNASSIKNIYATELIICDSSLNFLSPENFKGFYKLNELRFLNSSVLNFSSMSLKGLDMLTVLNLNGLNRSSEDITIFKHLPNLQHLDLSNYNIKNIVSELEGLYSLKKLNLSLNVISDLSVSSFYSLKKLEGLTLAYNQLSNIALGTFSPLEKLTHLYLSHNNLQKLLPGVFSGLRNLILLDISHNQLLRSKPHIWLSHTLPNLKYLYLQSNKLGNEYAASDNILRKYEFSLIANQASLEYIDINDNEWSCSTLIDVLASFRVKNVTFRPTHPVYKQTNINGVSCTA